jgi:hypothetical protein
MWLLTDFFNNLTIFSTALLTQSGLFAHFYLILVFMICKSNKLGVNCFLLVTTHYYTFKHIFNFFMKISINLEACCFEYNFAFSLVLRFNFFLFNALIFNLTYWICLSSNVYFVFVHKPTSQYNGRSSPT